MNEFCERKSLGVGAKFLELSFLGANVPGSESSSRERKFLERKFLLPLLPEYIHSQNSKINAIPLNNQCYILKSKV